MKIAIIGTGNVGGALATRWAQAGHEINLGVKDTSNFKGKALLDNPNTKVYSTREAVGRSEVILVATPPHIAVDLANSFGDLSGKTLIDATNSVRSRPEPYATAFHAFADLTQAGVVKCFNSTGFENMIDPVYGDVAIDMFMAGGDAGAKSVAEELAKDAGFENCYDFGGPERVELLEQFALSWINLAIFQKQGRGIAFKVIKR